MRPNRLRFGAIAAWLGVIALGLNALVPIHLAFDLAHALAGEEPGNAASEPEIAASLLELVLGHHDADHQTGTGTRHRHADCAVCGSLGALAGFAPAAAAILPLPVRIAAPSLLVTARREPPAAPAVVYRSRAPPIASAHSTA